MKHEILQLENCLNTPSHVVGTQPEQKISPFGANNSSSQTPRCTVLHSDQLCQKSSKINMNVVLIIAEYWLQGLVVLASHLI